MPVERGAALGGIEAGMKTGVPGERSLACRDGQQPSCNPSLCQDGQDLFFTHDIPQTILSWLRGFTILNLQVETSSR